jgi:hypothetical protein
VSWANSQHPHHTAQTRALHAYLRWRNANARHPDVLAAASPKRKQPDNLANLSIGQGCGRSGSELVAGLVVALVLLAQMVVQ